MNPNDAASFLRNFSTAEALAVEAMIRAMKFVSADDFTERVARLLKRRLEQGKGPVGIYVEREVGHRKGRPHRLFREEGTRKSTP